MPVDLDLEFLAAGVESLKRRAEMLPLIADAVGVSANELLYAWGLSLSRRCREVNGIPNTPWRLRFHGLECDLSHASDGRYLRYDFGPGGRADCLNPLGILEFVMTGKPPWPEFPALRQHLAKSEPPYTGDYYRAAKIWERLEARGCFAPADPELLALRKRYTTQEPTGNMIRLPEGTSMRIRLDALIADRPILAPRAFELLAECR
jgi:hypothetical protein